MSKSPPIRVVIADTAFLIRKGLRTLVKENPRFEYVTEAADAVSLNSALKTYHPDVLIVDHCCDDCFSLSVIRKIKADYPAINILVISHEKTAEEIKKIISIKIIY
ncbi:MAG: response regulator [Bacteroidia bacterium]